MLLGKSACLFLSAIPYRKVEVYRVRWFNLSNKAFWCTVIFILTHLMSENAFCNHSLNNALPAIWLVPLNSALISCSTYYIRGLSSRSYSTYFIEMVLDMMLLQATYFNCTCRDTHWCNLHKNCSWSTWRILHTSCFHHSSLISVYEYKFQCNKVWWCLGGVWNASHRDSSLKFIRLFPFCILKVSTGMHKKRGRRPQSCYFVPGEAFCTRSLLFFFFVFFCIFSYGQNQHQHWDDW